MENIFIPIEDKKQLDELLKQIRAAYRATISAKDTAQKIITRKIGQPEWVRTINRNLFPRLQQMSYDLREIIADVKEQRVNVQEATGKHDSSRPSQPNSTI